MILDYKVTEIYFIIDEFFKEFDKTIKENSLPSEQRKETASSQCPGAK